VLQAARHKAVRAARPASGRGVGTGCRTTGTNYEPAACVAFNRRLYDTLTSSYITLADVKKMVLEGAPFEVRDAKSGDELTRAILLQIILEEETGGVPMFNTQMLAQIIRFYGHAMQGVMGSYLEKNLQALAEMQGRFAEPGKGLYDTSALTPEGWTKFISGQAPMMQNLMGNYLEQSKKLFEQMQEQMTKPGESIFHTRRSESRFCLARITVRSAKTA
jgi:polyhydroxyalkanoate synthesis repressor PhaR